jgi:ABC-type transport system involved in multi-copper enzyme maturation permease subunit
MIGLQTRALLVDAYRELNARKIFWLVIVITLLALGIFAVVGVRDGQITFLNGDFPLSPVFTTALAAYKDGFTTWIVHRWLGVGSTLLALISTASIFPDLIAGGSIDLYLSKPVGRTRLFLTKYVMGLMFVALQVTLVAGGSFVIMGIRAGYWAPQVFLAIPIVLTFFSYLYSICVLIGILTRSAMAALFLTLLAWALIFGLNTLELFSSAAPQIYKLRAQLAEDRLGNLDSQIKSLQAKVGAAATGPSRDNQKLNDQAEIARLQHLFEQNTQWAAQKDPPTWMTAGNSALFAVNTVIPKTTQTIDLLDRVLISDNELATPTPTLGNSLFGRGQTRPPDREMRSAVEQFVRSRSVWWIVGSSLGFEALMIGLACWIFCRRDY